MVVSLIHLCDVYGIVSKTLFIFLNGFRLDFAKLLENFYSLLFCSSRSIIPEKLEILRELTTFTRSAMHVFCSPTKIIIAHAQKFILHIPTKGPLPVLYLFRQKKVCFFLYRSRIFTSKLISIDPSVGRRKKLSKENIVYKCNIEKNKGYLKLILKAYYKNLKHVT